MNNRMLIGTLMVIGLILATSSPAGTVTPWVSSSDNSPGPSAVIFTYPAGQGGVNPLNSTYYMQVNGFTVYAVPRALANANWSPKQGIKIDWYLLYWNGQTWVTLPPQRQNGSTDFVTDGGVRLRYPAVYFGATPGYYYTFLMRIAWLNDTTKSPMAAAYYYFNQFGDLQCASSRCYSYYTNVVPTPAAPNGPIKYVYYLYLY